MQRRNVDLPDPDGPMMHSTSPSWTSTSMPCKMRAAPKLFSTPRACTTTRGAVAVTTATAPRVVVHARGVEKSFGAARILQGIDVDVHEGEVLCIIGPSGSGKSTFLRCINHLEKIDSGELVVNDSFVGYRRRGDKLYELRDSEICRER